MGKRKINITPDSVQFIRESVRNKTATIPELVEQFSVSRSTIYRIINGESRYGEGYFEKASLALDEIDGIDDNDAVRQILRMAIEEDKSPTQIALQTNLSIQYITEVLKSNSLVNGDHSALARMYRESARLLAQNQKLRDNQTHHRRNIKLYGQAYHSFKQMNDDLVSLLSRNSLAFAAKEHKLEKSEHTIVIQFSDLHFNEIVSNLNNQFNTKVASQRIYKFVQNCKRLAKAYGATKCVVAFTGDLLNSPRRIGEITEAATSRAQAMFIAVEVLSQAITDLSDDMEVVVATVVGNESRFADAIEWTDLLASDSADISIHNMLTILFKDNKRVSFIPTVSPLECVLNVNGKNILMIHGHGHGFAARNVGSAHTQLKAKYASQGIAIDYTICGHIHECHISDTFARSSGLPGNNHYSEKALNLDGRSSQNCYIVSQHDIHSIKVDLQEVPANSPHYNYADTLRTYGIVELRGSGNSERPIFEV